MLETMYSDFCNALYALVSNNLFIAICSAWLTNFLSNMSSAYKDYLKNIQKRLYFVNNVLFTIEQNYLWTQYIHNGFVDTNEWYKNIKHINLIEIDYNSGVDKFLVKIINAYETILTNTYIIYTSNKVLKTDNATFKTFEDATKLAKDSLSTAIRIYENNMENSAVIFIRNYFNLQSKEQLELQDKLKKMVNSH